MIDRTIGGAPSVRTRREGRRKASRKGKAPVHQLSNLRKPPGLSLEAWQLALRRQAAAEARFRVKKQGRDPLFGEYRVTNPKSKSTYRVVLRGSRPWDNFCSCPDYALNTLGTCKHIEFLVRKIGRNRALRERLDAGFRPSYSEIFLRYGLQREVVFRAGTSCPEEVRRRMRHYFDDRGLLKPDAFARFDVLVKQLGAHDHEVRCYEDAIRFVAQVRDRERLRRRVDELFPEGADSPALARLLKTDLYPYQKTGALFAARAGRCLLADDMGLGKTVQAIAAAEILHRAVGLERVLVVTPTSLKHQWKSEIERFAGRRAVVVEGLLRRRRELFREASSFKIVNYDVLHASLPEIRDWQPDLVILDEAQRIKNWKTRTAQTVKKLESDYAIVLTGTPLENRLEELHSIVEFVDRHHLGPRFRFLSEHQQLDENGRVIGYRNLNRIAETLRPILLRRHKKEVLAQLPERLEKRFFVPMTDEQWRHHEENREIVARIVAKWKRFGFLSEEDQRRLMIALQNMRMSCDSTFLIDEKTDHGRKADEFLTIAEEWLESPNARMVVFSQWVRMLELVGDRLRRKRLGHVLFHGGVPGPKRRELIERFREDAQCRLFLSTDAGGVGLNLQHANAVVNLDLPWNPAVLEQRIGRVHRLGQRQPVQVVNLIAEGTIEHGMLDVLAFKKGLFSGVLDGGSNEVFLGGTRLKKFLDSVERVSGAIPAAGNGDAGPPDPGAVADAGGVGSPVRAGAAIAVSGGNADETPGRTTDKHGVPAGACAGVSRDDRAGRPDGTADSLSARDGSETPAAPSEAAAALAGWQRFFAAGRELLDGMARAVLPSGTDGVKVERDPQTGQAYVKLPLPSPDALAALETALSVLRGAKAPAAREPGGDAAASG